MTDIANIQKDLYQKQYQKHGDNPQSLMWNDRETQNMRFSKLVKVLQYEDSPSTLHEVGCGLGHFKDYLASNVIDCSYSGSDIVPEFIKKCQEKYPDSTFLLQDISKPLEEISKEMVDHDYYCISGTFYTKEDIELDEWETFVFESVTKMFRMAKKGIAFNMLTIHSDYTDPKLYYGNPEPIMKRMIETLSRFVMIDHTAPLYEFTVYVYKEEFMKRKYPGFSKYFRPL